MIKLNEVDKFLQTVDTTLNDEILDRIFSSAANTYYCHDEKCECHEGQSWFLKVGRIGLPFAVDAVAIAKDMTIDLFDLYGVWLYDQNRSWCYSCDSWFIDDEHPHQSCYGCAEIAEMQDFIDEEEYYEYSYEDQI
jgi:hypothetical protein